MPFTRWVTPTNLPKRFTTQMYIYMLPLSRSSVTDHISSDSEYLDSETVIPQPTHDGGLEHTAARFLPPSTWLRLAQAGRIILFPPQFFLLHLLSQFLSPHNPSLETPILPHEQLESQRKTLLEFIHSGDPSWGEKCISPTALGLPDGKRRDDGRVVLGLDRPGPELQGRRRGDDEHVVLVEFKKEGPRRLEVRNRKQVLAEGRSTKL